MESQRNGAVVQGDVEFDGRVILYIIKGIHPPLLLDPHPSLTGLADQTSYINYIKPLILAEELQCPHVISVIDSQDEWYYRIHPERYVPALRDQDPETKEEIAVFEGTGCLQYLAERFDIDGSWNGRTVAEKAAVLSWTAYQTAGLGFVGCLSLGLPLMMIYAERQPNTGYTFSRVILPARTRSLYPKRWQSEYNR